MNKLLWGLLAVPVSIAARIAGADTLVFVSSIVAILPLAGLMGQATEELAIHSGPRVGGFLNATFGNAAELIIGIFLITGGEAEVVKASITGSIIGNILLVLGAALLLGGLRYREQEFDPKVTGMHATSLVLAVIGLMMPALFHRAVPNAEFVQTETVSIGVAIVLMTLYVSSVVFSFVTHQTSLSVPVGDETAEWSRRKALLILGGATALVALESEFLVHSLETATESLGLSKFFVGLILVPIAGNAAEHASAVFLALRNKTDVAIEIAIGSSTQIAMFVAPLLVFISLAVGKPMDFFFTGFEIAAVAFSTAIVTLISLDGKSNWLEGAQLLAAYVIMGLSFYFLPVHAAANG
jgi:Ca2+:H+ antiporter